MNDGAEHVPSHGPLSWLVATRRSPEDLREDLVFGPEVVRYKLEIDSETVPTMLCARLGDTSVVVNVDRTYRMLRAGRRDRVAPVLLAPLGDPIRTRDTFGVQEPSETETLSSAVQVIQRELGRHYTRVSAQGPGAAEVIRRLINSGSLRATTLVLTTRLPPIKWHHDGIVHLPRADQQPAGTVVLAWAPIRERTPRSPETYFEDAGAQDEALAAHLARRALDMAGLLVHTVADGVIADAQQRVPVLGGGEVDGLVPGGCAAFVQEGRRWVEVWRGEMLSASHFAPIIAASATAHSRAVLADEPFVNLGLGLGLGLVDETRRPPGAPIQDVEEDRVQQAQVAQLTARLETFERALRAARRESAAMARELERLSELAHSPVIADVAAEDEIADSEARIELPEEPADLSCPTAALRAARALPHVIVTDHAIETAAVLDAQSKAALWGKRCWRILVDLERYAATRPSHRGIANFRAYLSQLDDPAVAATQVAIRESETVLNSPRMRAERVRAVPYEVDPSGQALFLEHVRVESGGRGVAPRLYFLDDTSGGTGRIVVGYVGPHLTNAST